MIFGECVCVCVRVEKFPSIMWMSKLLNSIHGQWRGILCPFSLLLLPTPYHHSRELSLVVFFSCKIVIAIAHLLVTWKLRTNHSNASWISKKSREEHIFVHLTKLLWRSILYCLEIALRQHLFIRNDFVSNFSVLFIFFAKRKFRGKIWKYLALFLWIICY